MSSRHRPHPTQGHLATIKGFIAAKVQGASGTGVADVPVDISGAASQTRVTADDGCAVFAVEAIGNYTVNLDDPWLRLLRRADDHVEVRYRRQRNHPNRPVQL